MLLTRLFLLGEAMRACAHQQRKSIMFLQNHGGDFAKSQPGICYADPAGIRSEIPAGNLFNFNILCDIPAGIISGILSDSPAGILLGIV